MNCTKHNTFYPAEHCQSKQLLALVPLSSVEHHNICKWNIPRQRIGCVTVRMPFFLHFLGWIQESRHNRFSRAQLENLRTVNGSSNSTLGSEIEPIRPSAIESGPFHSIHRPLISCLDKGERRAELKNKMKHQANRTVCKEQ